jgi:hypothetical protein
MTDYLNGKPVLEVLGSPKTVRLEGEFKGETFSAPMEVWIMALVATLDDGKKEAFFNTMKRVMEDGEYKRIQRAQVVADIPMPRIK